jgi:hypothetical protein
MLLESAENFLALEQQNDAKKFADDFAQPTFQYRVPMAMIDNAKQLKAEGKKDLELN